MNARLSMGLSGSPLAVPIYRLHRRLYTKTGGRLGGRLFGNDVLLLTTRGRRTGRAWTWPLLYFRLENAFLVLASNGGSDQPPGWYSNLRAHPAAHVQVRRRIQPVTAREALGRERDELWQLAVAGYPNYAEYQAATDRIIPLIVLEYG